MGRMILIVVLGFIVIFGYVRSNLNRTAERAMDNSSEFAEGIQLSELTTSALEYALSIYIQSGNTDTSVVDSSWLEGAITVSIALNGRDTINNVDTVLITASSEINGSVGSSQIILISKSLMIPPITASVGVISESASFSFSGNVEIHGQDTKMDGTTGTAPELPGITVSNQDDSTDIANNYGGTTFIQGSGPEPSISVSSDTTTDLTAIVQYYAAIADQSLSNCVSLDEGSENSPTIAHIDGDCTMNGTLDGYGVLVIEGSLTMRGNVHWNGLVIVVGESSMEFDASGTPSIFGALLLGAPQTELSMSGTADLYYSSEAIQMVQEGLENSGRNRRFLSDITWWE